MLDLSSAVNPKHFLPRSLSDVPTPSPHYLQYAAPYLAQEMDLGDAYLLYAELKVRLFAAP